MPRVTGVRRDRRLEAGGPKARVQAASAKRASTLRQPPVCPQPNWQRNVTQKARATGRSGGSCLFGLRLMPTRSRDARTYPLIAVLMRATRCPQRVGTWHHRSLATAKTPKKPRAAASGRRAGALGGQPFENQKGRRPSTGQRPLATTKVSRHYHRDAGTMSRRSEFQ